MASNEASSKPTTVKDEYPPFDFSAMSRMVNDPSIQELAEQIAKDPSFNRMSEEFFYSMNKVMMNPDFKTMAMRLANALIQDPSMSSMLNNFTNLQNRPNKEETMARINEDPSLKHILDEIETGGPAAMMRYWNDDEVLKKLGLVMGINPNTGEVAAASSDNPLGLGSPLPEDRKKLLFGFILKLNLVDYAHSRKYGPKTIPLGPKGKSFGIHFYQMGYGRSKSGANLSVQETKPVNWRKSLLPLLAKLKEEEKVKLAKLEEKVNVTELERLKVKVPRFTKEIILVIYLHHIFEDMGRYNSCEASNRRWQEKELVAEGIERSWAELKLKGMLK
ncbi:hypothetical protein P8452_63557 [Trifolium repens]|nr:hypothetical protein P8452_63557 [Trifolium repens]